MHRKEKVNDIFISKTLSWILRHGAIQEGFNITSEGYVKVAEILSDKHFKGKCTIEDIYRVVENNNKKRFTLRSDCDGNLEIKANQGHSLENVFNLELQAITTTNQVKNIIHGTYYKYWDSIKKNGLSRMKRIHIHFTSDLSSNKITSGMRSDVEIAIYIDIIKALKANLKFYISPNGVILSPGNSNGIIESSFFFKVIDIKSGELLSF